MITDPSSRPSPGLPPTSRRLKAYIHSIGSGYRTATGKRGAMRSKIAENSV